MGTKECYQFYLYVMIDRQGRINENNQKIQSIKKELNADLSYRKCVEAITKINRKKATVEAKLKEIHKSNIMDPMEFMIHANQIQALADEIKEKETIIRFLQMMIAQLEKHPRFPWLTMWIQFTKQNKQVAIEEFNGSISIGSQFLLFMKLLTFILKNERYQTKTNTTFQSRLSLLLIYYQNFQHKLLMEKEKKEEKFYQKKEMERKRFYQQQKLQKNNNELDRLLLQATQYMKKIKEKRIEKQNTIAHLEQLNEQFQLHIDHLREMYMETTVQSTTNRAPQYKIYQIGNRG